MVRAIRHAETASSTITGPPSTVGTSRADRRSNAPQCSAIMTRGYEQYKQIPVWFFNLPPTDNNLPVAEDRPPYAGRSTGRCAVIFDADEAGGWGWRPARR
jgi:hypothetical protein